MLIRHYQHETDETMTRKIIVMLVAFTVLMQVPRERTFAGERIERKITVPGQGKVTLKLFEHWTVKGPDDPKNITIHILPREGRAFHFEIGMMEKMKKEIDDRELEKVMDDAFVAEMTLHSLSGMYLKYAEEETIKPVRIRGKQVLGCYGMLTDKRKTIPDDEFRHVTIVFLYAGKISIYGIFYHNDRDLPDVKMALAMLEELVYEP